MRIAIINPPHEYLIQPNAQAPLGLAYLSSMIKKYRPHVQVDILNYSHKTIKEAINDIDQYDVYGYTATVVDYFTCEEMVDGVKERFPNSTHILGGPHATISHDLVNIENFRFYR